MLYELMRPALFRLDAETAHEAASRMIEACGRLPMGRSLLALSAGAATPGLEVEVLGLRFPNPIGLAAGFDKHCRLLGALPALGFGFAEAGSITLRPQPGNPRPRLFRIPEAQALLNRMGFNSEGAPAAARRLKALASPAIPIGINLGLNKDCPLERAADEYAETFSLLAPYGDYFAVNVSSPNTEGLRSLRERMKIERILAAIRDANTARKPVLVKLDPDLDEAQLPPILEAIQQGASGVIAGNTTVSRRDLPERWRDARGGVSGAPLRAPSNRLIARIYRLTRGKLPIVGAGGVFTGADAFAKIRAGASLVQLYTGFVYGGPATATRAQRELAALLKRFGYATVADAVGSGAEEPVK